MLLHDPAGGMIQDLSHAFGGTFILNSGFSRVTTRDESAQAIDDDIAPAG